MHAGPYRIFQLQIIVMTEKPTLICIPDISGFTKFMSEVDFELSSKVIPALLNNIIYANEIGLKVSEIEGDAVLFFKTGELPSLKVLVEQCKTFYAEFYKQIDVLIKKYKKEHSDVNFPELLGLKIILHVGEEIAMVPIGNRIKLMGEDVITAHRLLKNEVPLEEYILLSNKLLDQFKNSDVDSEFNWDLLHEMTMDLEHIGSLKFNYIDLQSLNKK